MVNNTTQKRCDSAYIKQQINSMNDTLKGFCGKKLLKSRNFNSNSKVKKNPCFNPIENPSEFYMLSISRPYGVSSISYDIQTPKLEKTELYVPNSFTSSLSTSFRVRNYKKLRTVHEQLLSTIDREAPQQVAPAFNVLRINKERIQTINISSNLNESSFKFYDPSRKMNVSIKKIRSPTESKIQVNNTMNVKQQASYLQERKGAKLPALLPLRKQSISAWKTSQDQYQF